jgi:nucleoside-diphosphate-sugar epimerase
MGSLYLVTGGAGFIGSHIVQRLVKDGEKVRVVDNLCTGSLTRLAEVISAIEFIEGDLAEPSVCDRVIEGVDHVIHQAAIPSVQRSIRDPLASNRANITATLNLLESCRNRHVRRLVYAASSSAYGDTKVLPKHEEMPANPLSPYALQKLVGERYCKLYYELYGLETVSLRYFNVFGPGQDPNSEYSAVIPKFISRLLAGQPVTVFGDGEQSRDFTYVDNVVEANLLALGAKEAAGKVLNVGCGQRFSLNELIHMLEKILGLTARVEYLPPRAGDVRDSLAAIDMARAILGYRPGVSVEEGLRRTAAFFSRDAETASKQSSR